MWRFWFLTKQKLQNEILRWWFSTQHFCYSIWIKKTYASGSLGSLMLCLLMRRDSATLLRISSGFYSTWFWKEFVRQFFGEKKIKEILLLPNLYALSVTVLKFSNVIMFLTRKLKSWLSQKYWKLTHNTSGLGSGTSRAS